MKKLALVLLASTTVVLTGAACSELVRAPTVELTGVRLRGIGLGGATLLTRLRIHNPNRFAIESDSIAFQFDAREPEGQMGWTPVTSGTNTERIRLEGNSEIVVELPIDFAYSDLGMPARTLIDRGALTYRISGEVFLRRPLRRGVRFQEDGTLSLGS